MAKTQSVGTKIPSRSNVLSIFSMKTFPQSILVFDCSVCNQLGVVALDFRFGKPFKHQHVVEVAEGLASLIGCLGQALFPCFFWVIVAHPGHASLRSLIDAVMAPLHAYVGLAVESPAFRRASNCAADIFGFIHKPRPVRTFPLGLDGWRF